MQQRVGIARALAIDPQILLMDEPFSAVDAQTREVLQDELLRILAARPMRVLFVTHSIEEALYLSDRIVVLSPRPSRVLADVAVPLPKPRWEHDVQALPEYLRLRREIRGMIGLAVQ
jgi:NitT/TauT family transport system ATP-binding protein